MDEGRGGAAMAMAVICLLAAALQCEAGTIYVGENAGWSMNISRNWGSDIRFFHGDTFVFHYPKGKHNVVAVDQIRYEGCFATPRDKVYTSGNDEVKIARGFNYFICSFPNHCSKMKIRIFAF